MFTYIEFKIILVKPDIFLNVRISQDNKIEYNTNVQILLLYCYCNTKYPPRNQNLLSKKPVLKQLQKL